MDEGDSSADPQKRRYPRGFELSTVKLIIVLVLKHHSYTSRITDKPTTGTSRVKKRIFDN